MNYETYTTTELEILLANGLSAIKTLKQRRNFPAVIDTAKNVEAIRNEIFKRYLEIKI
jgi:hypothetical protein